MKDFYFKTSCGCQLTQNKFFFLVKESVHRCRMDCGMLPAWLEFSLCTRSLSSFFPDSNSWDEHVFELVLPKACMVGHVDFKFVLNSNITNIPQIQVTLLKNKAPGLGKVNGKKKLGYLSKHYFFSQTHYSLSCISENVLEIV